MSTLRDPGVMQQLEGRVKQLQAEGGSLSWGTSREEDPEVIVHIVLLKWKPDVTNEEVLEAFSQARDLPNEIPGVQRITIGRHYGESKHAFTHAISVQLNDERALEDYLSHPARLQYNAQYLEPIEEERIEIDVPTTMTLLPDPHRNWEWGRASEWDRRSRTEQRREPAAPPVTAIGAKRSTRFVPSSLYWLAPLRMTAACP